MSLSEWFYHNQLTESLWGDEGFSALAVQEPFLEMIGIVMRDTAPPMFYVTGFLWGRMFGFSEIGLRSLTLLLILGSAIFAGLIVNRFQKEKVVAILTGFLAFLSPFLMPFAFEWRMYALLTFTVMGSIYFFMARRWKWYVGFAVAALYTHHFALFTVVAQGLWFLFDEFSHWKSVKAFGKHLWPFLLVVGLYVPWLYPMYLQTKRVQGAGFWLSVPKVKEVGGLILKFMVGGVTKEWWLIVGGLVTILLISKNWKRVGKKWLELVVIFLMPVVLAVGVSYLVTPIFYDRYLLSVVVGMAVLVGLGTKKKFIPVLIALVIIYGWQSFNQFTHPSKREFREMATYIKQEKTEADYLLNYNGRAHHLWESKYYGIPAPIYTPDGPLPLYVGTAQMKESDTTEGLPEIEGRLGVIASEPIETITLSGYKVVEEKQFGGLVFSWWKQE